MMEVIENQDLWSPATPTSTAPDDDGGETIIIIVSYFNYYYFGGVQVQWFLKKY